MKKEFRFLGSNDLYAFINDGGDLYHLGQLQAEYQYDLDYEQFDEDERFTLDEVKKHLEEACESLSENTAFEHHRIDEDLSIKDRRLLASYFKEAGYDDEDTVMNLNANLEGDTSYDRGVPDGDIIYSDCHIGMISSYDCTVKIKSLGNNTYQITHYEDHGGCVADDDILEDLDDDAWELTGLIIHNEYVEMITLENIDEVFEEMSFMSDYGDCNVDEAELKEAVKEYISKHK